MSEPTARETRVPRTILLLGLTSLFNDVSSEMIFPLLPAFLLTLGAGPALLGLIEGAADALSSVLKLVSGRLSDRMPRKKPLVLAGYSLAALVRPLVAVAAAPFHVLVVRLTDRLGKGIRTSPRDVLIAAAARPGQAGRAFGFHRSMDHLGAVLGPLLATALVALGLGSRAVFALAAIPGLIAVGCLLLVREEATRVAPEAPPPVRPGDRRADGAPARLPSHFRRYLAVLGLFSLGNASDAFLLLRARELGVGAVAIPLLWAALHVSKVTSSFLGGRQADRMRRARLIATGWLLYLLTYVGLALAGGPAAVWVLFLLYGVYHGLTEPAERALVRDLVPESQRGRAYGAYNFVIGIAAIPAGLLAGWLWERQGAPVALLTGAALAGAAAVLLLAWDRHRPPASPPLLDSPPPLPTPPPAPLSGGGVSRRAMP